MVPFNESFISSAASSHPASKLKLLFVIQRSKGVQRIDADFNQRSFRECLSSCSVSLTGSKIKSLCLLK